MTIKTKTELDALNLQLFAEGSGTGAEGSTADTGSFANSAEGVNGKSTNVQTADAQNTDTNPVVDRNAEFEKLIKDDYKDLYDAKVQSIVQNRLKGTKEDVAKLKAITPLLDMIAQKYGVDSSDTQALIKAVEEDESYIEDEALRRGIPTSEMKNILKIERENAAVKRENEKFHKEKEEREARERQAQIYNTWTTQAEEAKKLYPNLDLETELKNEQFGRMLLAGIDVGSAYLVAHKDEIIGGAMQHTAKIVEKKITDKIAANGRRPSEGGNSSQSASVTKTDVSQFNNNDIDDVIKKVRNGGRVILG